MASSLLRLLARLVLAVFFRQVRVEGARRMPRSGGVIVVANHFNGLIDGALLLAHLPRRPSFLAKSTLWDVPFLQPLLDLAGAIPVIRRQDLPEGGRDTAAVGAERNRATFDRCEELLGDGGVVALFPEGTTHRGPSLQPLRSGAARIALRTRARVPSRLLWILPAGLHFDAADRFRSRALVELGEPLTVPETAGDRAPLVQTLTERIRVALERLTPSYASWEEARLLERAIELYHRSLRGSQDEQDRLALRGPFVEIYERLRRLHPVELAAAVRSLSSYHRLLETFGVREDLVELGEVSRRGALAWGVRTAASLLLLLPLAAIGGVLNWLPYRVPAWVASRWAEGPEVVATYKVFTSLVVFPLAWLLEAGVVGFAAGLGAGIAALVLAPATGFAALVFQERRRELAERTRAWVLLRRGRLAVELSRRRHSVLEQIERLRELDR